MNYFTQSKPRLVGAAAAVLLWAAAGIASAAPCTERADVAGSLGNASTDDVTLGGSDSDACVISGVNAQAGPNGDPSAFDTEFGGGWSLLAKIDSGGNISPNPSTVDGVTFTIGFTVNPDNVSGTWSLETDIAATFDLVFAMHAGGRTGSFLFDNEATAANVTEPGTWVIEWLNNGGQVPDFSNLTLFVRDIEPGNGNGVPEPATALLALGALAGLARTRRQKS